MAAIRVIAAATVACALGGCASVEHTVAEWYPGDRAAPARATVAPSAQTVFVGTERLAVHDAPEASSKVVGRLRLHAAVTRSGVERGYALVSAGPGGPEGWVDNAKLLARLPAPQPAGPGAAGPGAAGPGAAAATPLPSPPDVAGAPAGPRPRSAAEVTEAANEPVAQPPVAATPVSPVVAPTAPAASPRAEPEMIDPF